MSDISKIILPDGNQYNLKDAVARTTYYGVCSDVSSTVNKTVTLQNGDGFELKTGVTIAILFNNLNKAKNPTLNVNQTGAKAIKLVSTGNPGVGEYIESWRSGETVLMVYDGTYWRIIKPVFMYASEDLGGVMSAQDKRKLNNIEANAEVNVQSDWNETSVSSDAYILNKPDVATTTTAGLMSASDKTKLNGIASGAVPNYFGVCSDSGVTREITVDSSFVLAEGVMINVFFENASTSQATLNVNNTGAYPIYIYGTQAVSNSIAWGWREGQLIELVFHDSKWWVQNQYFNNAGTTTSGLMTSSHVTKLNSLDPNSTTPIQLTNQDLNDIHPTNTTWYYAGGGNTVTNVPGSWVTSFGMVCFRTAGGYIIQKLWPTSWSYAYSRTWNGTTWSEWRYDAKDATTNEAGFMSTTDKQTLDGLSSIELTNEDLNDLHPLKTTFYWSEAGNTCTHKPTAITVNSFALICLRTTNTWMLQICIHPTSNRQWRRHYNAQANTWSAWSEITYSWNAARTYAGLMSAADKVKLDDLKASTINVTDTYGVTGTVGATVTIQALMDAIASKI